MPDRHGPDAPSGSSHVDQQVNMPDTPLPSDVTPRQYPNPTVGLVFAPGTEPVPGYRLLCRLGRGGFGEVWKATGPGGFEVALKFIFLGDKGATVELRALELMKDVRHPHLLSIFGTWQHDGFLILALELADRTIADRLQETRAQGLIGIPRDELLEYMREVAKGIDHLNSIGVQHRDIKPANLLLIGGGAKVGDFGLAKVLERTLATNSGSMTPAYAPPEVLVKQIHTHSDQYSLAVSYCELRGGRLPYTGNPLQVMIGHLQEPPDLSMVSESERLVLQRALDKQPAARWPSCRSFVEALAAAEPDQTGSTPPAPADTAWTVMQADAPLPLQPVASDAAHTLPPPSESASLLFQRSMPRPDTIATPALQWPSPPRKKRVGLGIGLSVVSLIILTAIIVHEQFRVRESPSLNRLAVDTIPEDKTEVPVELTNSPARGQPNGPISGGEPRPPKIGHVGDGVVFGLNYAKTLNAQKDYNGAIAEVTKLIEKYPREPDPYDFRAGVYLSLGKFEEAVADYTHLIRHYTTSIGLYTTDPNYPDRQPAAQAAILLASAYRRRGDAYSNKGEYNRAITDFSEALRLDPKSAYAFNGRGNAHYNKREYGKAVEDFTDAIGIEKKALYYRRRGDAYFQMADHDEAVADYSRAIHLEFGDVAAYNGLGAVYAVKGDYDSAITNYSKAVRIDSKSTYAHNGLGIAFFHKGDYDSAITEYSQAITHEPQSAVYFNNRGTAYFTKGDYDRAVTDFTDAINRDRESKIPSSYLYRGLAYQRKGDSARAAADFAKYRDLTGKNP